MGFTSYDACGIISVCLGSRRSTGYFRDHRPSHFHATYGGDEVLVEIETLRLYRGSLPRPQLAEVLAWARENQEMLRAAWERMQ